jgi:hypothetical protein
MESLKVAVRSSHAHVACNQLPCALIVCEGELLDLDWIGPSPSLHQVENLDNAVFPNAMIAGPSTARLLARLLELQDAISRSDRCAN